MNFIKDIEEGVKGSVLRALDSAISSVHPDTVIPENLELRGGKPVVAGEEIEGRIFVFGMGKASYHMAKALNSIMGSRIEGGILVSIKDEKLGSIEVRKGAHPFPDYATVKHTEEALELAKSLGKGDTAIVLISGGGSSMFCMPLPDISIEEIMDISGSLMRKGADIWELNTVRRSLSMVKGGGFTHYLRPARITSLIISDVVDNHLPSIASGPTVAVEDEGRMAMKILEKYGILEGISPTIEKALMQRKQRESADRNIIIADNRRAVNHASASLAAEGISHRIVNAFTGNVADIAEQIASMPFSSVMGGESTVEVRGNGRGGRNQELVLRALLSGFRGMIAAIGTDGIDGNSPYAGAIADYSTIKKAIGEGANPEDYLNNSDSSSFFERFGGAIKTGYTGTNVADIVVAVKDKLNSI